MINPEQPIAEQENTMIENIPILTVTQEEIECAVQKLIIQKRRKLMIKLFFMLIKSCVLLFFRKTIYVLYKYIFGPVFIVYSLPGAIAFAIIETFKNKDRFIEADGITERQDVIINLFKSRKDAKLRIFLLSLLFWGVIAIIILK